VELIRGWLAGAVAGTVILCACNSSTGGSEGATSQSPLSPPASSPLSPPASSGLPAAVDDASETAVTSSSSEGTRILAEQVQVRANLGPTAEQIGAWNAAIDSFSAKCGASYGYPNLPALGPIGTSDEDKSAFVDRFLFDQIEAIRANGYGYGSAEAEDGDVGGSADVPDFVLEDCRAPVIELFQITIESIGFDPAAIEVDRELVQEFLNDPAIIPAYEAWASCVVDRGFDDPRIRVENPRLLPTEVAIADSECQGTTGFRAAKVDWFTRRVARWLDENAEIVILSRQYWDELVAAAIELDVGSR
jgi:hypothetical protein